MIEHLMGVVTKDSLVLFRADNDNVRDFAARLSRVLKNENLPSIPSTTVFCYLIIYIPH